MNIINHKSRTLNNNIRIELFHRKNSPISLKFNIFGGDVYDVGGKTGLTHFVEHMLVVGTEHYPSKDKLAIYLDSYGITFGAVTWQDRMALNFYAPSKDELGIIFETIRDLISNNSSIQSNFETEKGSILSELSVNNNKPTFIPYNKFINNVFRGSKFASSTIGSKEDIESINKYDIENWIKRNIVTSKVGISVAGDVDMDSIVNLAEKYLINIKNDSCEKINLPFDQSNINIINAENNISFTQNSNKNTTIILGFKIDGDFSKNSNIETVLNSILGNRRSSLLMTKLRYETGLSYSPTSIMTRFFGIGIFYFQINCDSGNLKKVLDIIYNIVNTDFEKELTKERFELEQNHFNKNLIIDYEKVSNFNNFGSIISLSNTIKTFEDYVNERKKISYNEFLEVGKKFFKNREWFLSYSSDSEILDIVKYIDKFNNI